MFERKPKIESPMQPQIPKIDTITYMHVRSAVQAVHEIMPNRDEYRHFIAELRTDNIIDENGQFPKNDLEVALAIVKSQQEEREAIRLKQQAEQEHRAKIDNEPDSKIWRLWRNINSNPDGLTQYLMTYDLNALEKFLADLKARPLHYNSLFANGQLKDAIVFIETALEKRRNGNKPKNELVTAINQANKGLTETRTALRELGDKIDPKSKPLNYAT